MKWRFRGKRLDNEKDVEGSIIEYPDGRMLMAVPDPEMSEEEVCDLGLREIPVAPLTVELL
jgi:hypothetical protein